MTAKQFAKYLRQNGLTPAEVARRTGVSESMLSLILHGKRDFTLKMAVRLAHGLGERWQKFYTVIGG